MIPGTALPARVSGIPLLRTPKLTADITPTFDYPLPVGRLEATATASYNSGFYTAIGTPAQRKLWWQPSYTIVNATLSWISADDRYRVSVWGTNLANAKYSIYVVPAASGTGEALGAPWSVGASAAMKFR
jgi:iron complex outermembrane receptor protein